MPDDYGPKAGPGGVAAEEIRDVHITNKFGDYVVLDPKQLVKKISPVVLLLPLVFDRAIQDEVLSDTLDSCFEHGQRIIPIILPGPQDESPGHFVERYATFSLREVFHRYHDNEEYDFDKHPMDWPKRTDISDARFRYLLKDVWKMVSKGAFGDEESAKDSVQDWLKSQTKHQIFYYLITQDRVSKDDPALIKRWVDFWRSLDLDAAHPTVSVIFCLHSNKPFLFDRFEWSSRFAHTLKASIGADIPNMLFLDRLTSPNKKEDVDKWVNKHCHDAWNIAHRKVSDPAALPLDLAVLHEQALKAFGWWRWRRPLLKLMPKLRKAVEQAYMPSSE